MAIRLVKLVSDIVRHKGTSDPLRIAASACLGGDVGKIGLESAIDNMMELAEDTRWYEALEDALLYGGDNRTLGGIIDNVAWNRALGALCELNVETLEGGRCLALVVQADALLGSLRTPGVSAKLRKPVMAAVVLQCAEIAKGIEA